MNELTLKALANTAIAERPFPNPLFPPSPYYRFLKHLAAEMKPSLSVVLGVCGGGCCLHLAQGYGMGMVIGIDIVNDYPQNMEFIKQNHANFSLYLGDSTQSAFEIFKEYGHCNLLGLEKLQVVKESPKWDGRPQ